MLSEAKYLVLFLVVSVKSIVIEKDPGLPKSDVTKHRNWQLVNQEDCGLSLSDRIIGGKNASLGQYPWIARIGYTKKIESSEEFDDDRVVINIGKNKILIFECGGTLVSRRYVITAAHCTEGLPPGTKLTHIRLGEFNDLTDVDCEDDICAEPVQDFKPASIIPHPKYSPDLYKHDIALIRLNRPYVDNGWVYPICMVYGDLIQKDFVGEFGEIIGWGYTDEEDENVGHVLQTIQLPVVDTARCNMAYRRTTQIGISQFCVGGITGMDSCGGDSGGPLQKVESVGKQPPKYFLIGLVSFGSKFCGTSTKPAVYTRLANYMIWILSKMVK